MKKKRKEIRKRKKKREHIKNEKERNKLKVNSNEAKLILIPVFKNVKYNKELSHVKQNEYVVYEMNKSKLSGISIHCFSL